MVAIPVSSPRTETFSEDIPVSMSPVGDSPVSDYDEDDEECQREDEGILRMEVPAVVRHTTGQITVPVGSIYKDVVVIGNGPSGIALSYFLAGHWPYYNGEGESVNEMLHYRLMADEADGNARKSIVEQDLKFLSQVRTVLEIYACRKIQRLRGVSGLFING